MVIRAPSSRRLVAGTTGWRVQDLDDPQIESQWDANHFEILEGVLTEMPPAYYDGGVALDHLMDCVKSHLKKTKAGGHFATEVDLIISEQRLVKVDAVYLAPNDQRRQKQANAGLTKPRLVYGRLLLPPTLVVESVSLGHEARDEKTKRDWYAEFGIPNYWLLNAHPRTLECLVLDGGSYRVDQAGNHKDKLRPSLFPGLVIKLADIWLD